MAKREVMRGKSLPIFCNPCGTRAVAELRLVCSQVFSPCFYAGAKHLRNRERVSRRNRGESPV